MEDQISWKGHTFTLLVFTGIVVLASIFFVLGMLVGRAQAGKVVSTASAAAETAKADAKKDPKDERPDLTFYESVKKEPPAVLEPVPAKPEPAPKASAPETSPPPVTSKPESVVNFQIGALRKAADAERLLAELKGKGFRAFILSPAPEETNPYYRVQVGPFTDPIEAQDAKKKLEDAKYQPIPKK